jgi:hypothetical protein
MADWPKNNELTEEFLEVDEDKLPLKRSCNFQTGWR